MKKFFKNVQKINVSLLMDLRLYSLVEPKNVVEHIQQELGAETITKEDLQRNSNGNSLLH